MNITPLEDRIIIKPLETAGQTSGGIYIPESAKKKSQEGTVMAIGTGKVLEDGSVLESKLKIGDNVIYSVCAGSEIKVDKEDLLIVRENDVLAVVGKTSTVVK